MPDLTQEGLAARGLRVKALDWILDASGLHSGGYAIDVYAGSPWPYRAYLPSDPKGKSFRSLPEAQAFVNQHNAARILAALEDTGEPALIREVRSKAIRDFCDKAGIKPSDEVAALPDDVRQWRMETAVAARRAAAHRKDEEPK